MLLNRVEIHGFKSFSDRTLLEFPAGLTAVVGPNGCGKSNIMDAIKWALGEQRPGALRGDEMLDVIFKGNGSRAARNFAEVSLVFDNTEGVLPIEYAEVVVTRRLFRSGESEYLINRQSVRLKDVRNLFMDTGLGQGAYSILEQGRIDAVLSANPQDRRRIFEEAAGISRYRARRRESESKLQRTEQNLLRLGDVVEELERQQRSLKNQAGRARSYLEIVEQLRELKSLAYSHRWHEQGARIDELAAAVEAGEVTEVEARRVREAARAALEVLRSSQGTARGGVDEAAEAFRQATVAVEALTEREGLTRERLTELTQRRAADAARVGELQAGLAEREREAEEVAGRLGVAREGRDAAAQRAESARASVARARGDLDRWQSHAEQRRREALQRQSELTSVRNEHHEAGSVRATLSGSHQRLGERVEQLREELALQDQMQGELFAGAQSLNAAHQQQQQVVEAAQADHAAALSASEALGAELRERRELLAATTSRQSALQELIAAREGVAPGALTLLDSGLPGIEGLLADALRAPRALAPAVEAALGASAQALLVDSRATALAAAATLRSEQTGRVLLLPRDGLLPRTGAASGVRLLDRIRVDAAARPAAEALLGHVRLVDDASALADCVLDGGTAFVTPAGELLDEHGVLHAGQGGEEGGLVSRRSECDALGEDAQRLTAEVDDLDRRRGEAAALQARTEATLREAGRQAREVETERARAAERSRQATERRDVLARNLSVVERDLAQLAEQLTAAEQRAAAAAARAEELGRAVEADRGAESQADAEREALAAAFDNQRAALGAAETELSTLDERLSSLAAEGRQIERVLAERQAERERLEAELGELDARAVELSAEVERLAVRGRELADQRDTCAGALEQARARATGFEARIGECQAELDRAESGLAQAGEALAATRMKLQEFVIRRDSLREKVLEELEIDFAEHPPEVQGAERDWAAADAELEELRGRLARLGSVNMEAINELTAVEERLTFLTGQRDDLIAAKSSLAETINRVNKESRERFVTAFEEIREHFRVIFRKLFRGGRADIVLEEGVDVLDAGIDIVAAPPGKDSRSITLLSGGERTLTAVGLLFALFKARPSPVCMLDEVDAALDETNIDRFCTVLEDFLGESQFIVVTHARRTMSYADTLYGVTMQEHGVSKVISLTLAEYQQAQTAAKDVRAPASASRLGQSKQKSAGHTVGNGATAEAAPSRMSRAVVDEALGEPDEALAEAAAETAAETGAEAGAERSGKLSERDADAS